MEFISDVPGPYLGVMFAIRQSWCKETSRDPENWCEENPAYGQCAVSCMVFNSFFASLIVKGKVLTKIGWVDHYWLRYIRLGSYRPNGLSQEDSLDLTISQFYDKKYGQPYYHSYEQYIGKASLMNCGTRDRYYILRDKVKKLLPIKNYT